jgi:hypothetical protein
MIISIIIFIILIISGKRHWQASKQFTAKRPLLYSVVKCFPSELKEQSNIINHYKWQSNSSNWISLFSFILFFFIILIILGAHLASKQFATTISYYTLC